ncbi:MAG: Hsp20/alpha crystallin family protein [Patescibacteria group bacterium]|nr:Hsp20/alpha crystallin family protein [Patescibacteria group bacterium]
MPQIKTQKQTSPVKRSQDGQLSVDIFQTENEIIIISPIAGVNPDDVSITITDDVVTIKGERRNGTTVQKENCFIQECFWGSFSRSIVLPSAVDVNHAEAEFKNNVLILKIPKVEQAKTKVVKIKNS